MHSSLRGSRGRVDGRLVVILLFAGAFLLWGIVFYTGLQTKQGRGILSLRAPAAAMRDSTAHPDSLRAWLAGLPEEWVKVTPVEGQGMVILVPCYTSNSVLTLRRPADSLPQVECEYCDSLGRYQVFGMARDPGGLPMDILLNPPQGNIKVVAVSDSLLLRFPEAPFQDRILLWTRPRPAVDSAAAGLDTMVFVPASQENEFEVLRAEDENPEGCGPQAE